MRLIGGLVVAMIISACAGGVSSVSSLNFNIPVGTQIIVKQSIRILPESGRVYIQGGKVVALQERDQYEYYCWFLSWKVNETEQIIMPDTFIVSNVRHTDFYVQHFPETQVAMSDFSGKSLLAWGGATATDYVTELSIHSDQQPDIRRLACSYWGDPALGRHITVPEMQSVLGDLVHIEFLRIKEGNYDEK